MSEWDENHKPFGITAEVKIEYILKSKYDALESKLLRCKEALEFYSDQQNWYGGPPLFVKAEEYVEICDSDWIVIDPNKKIAVGGRRATEALAEIWPEYKKDVK